MIELIYDFDGEYPYYVTMQDARNCVRDKYTQKELSSICSNDAGLTEDDCIDMLIEDGDFDEELTSYFHDKAYNEYLETKTLEEEFPKGYSEAGMHTSW